MNNTLLEWKTEKHEIRMSNCGGGLKADECKCIVVMDYNLWLLNGESDIRDALTVKPPIHQVMRYT